MKHLHLIISDLFLPQDIAGEVCAGLRLPALEKLLARGKANTSPSVALEDRLCAAYGVQAVAPVRAVADGLDVGEGYWLCADPVNLQLQRAQMMLLPDVMPGKEEADALCAALDAHFAEGKLRFFAPHPQRWYVRPDREPQLTTAPLSRVAWGDAKYHQPHGADALYWQAIVNEAQMLLHDHPVNRAREARGELVINSLWLWGGGRATAMKRSFEVSGGDSGLARLFAEAADVRPRHGGAKPTGAGVAASHLLDETTSHSTRLQEAATKSLVIPQSAGYAITSDLASVVGSPSRMASSSISNVPARGRPMGSPLLRSDPFALSEVRRIDSLQAVLDAEYESGLWVCEALSSAFQRGDLYAWREAVQQFEQECAKPLLQALQTGHLHHLAIEVLQPEGVRRFELARSSVWKLWRPVHPLARYAV